MIRVFLLLPLMLSATIVSAEETPFEPSRDGFADAAACKAHLAALVRDASARRLDAVEGPYVLAAGDIRIHIVQAEGNGHRITEHRCLADKLSSRSWRHSMAAGAEVADGEFTVDSVARTAPWFKKGRGEQ